MGGSVGNARRVGEVQEVIASVQIPTSQAVLRPGWRTVASIYSKRGARLGLPTSSSLHCSYSLRWALPHTSRNLPSRALKPIDFLSLPITPAVTGVQHTYPALDSFPHRHPSPLVPRVRLVRRLLAYLAARSQLRSHLFHWLRAHISYSCIHLRLTISVGCA